LKQIPRPGPLFGSKLNAKIIGKIANPASIAIRVSSEATVKEVLTTFDLLAYMRHKPLLNPCQDLN